MKRQMIYMDHAAATPVDPDVLAVMQPYFTERFYNPSATYAAGTLIRKELDSARARIAHWFGARPSEIIFTAGATEANNLAIHGVMAQFPTANLIVSAIEHESVLEPALQYKHSLAPVNNQGIVDVKHLKSMIDDDTVLVSVQYANNEIGTIQPLKQVGQLIADIRKQRTTTGNKLPLYLHTDAAQAAAYLNLHAARLGADFISINGGKIYGPKQSGALYIRAGTKLAPLVYGGGQESGLRSGTENVPGCIGLSVALDKVQNARHEETRRMQDLQRRFYEGLKSEVPIAIVNGSTKHRLPNNVHITLPGSDNERLLFALDEAGIMAAAGSACSASDDTPSHVLKALGMDDAAAQASLRFTLGHETTSADIDSTISALASVLA